MTKNLFVTLRLVQLQHTMESCTHQLHDLAYHSLVERHAWTPWLLLYACYSASMISSPTSPVEHWTFCLWQMLASQTLLPWSWFTPQSRYCWCSLGGSCSWTYWTMACFNITWHCDILYPHLHWHHHQPSWNCMNFWKVQWPCCDPFWAYPAFLVS